MTLGRRQAESEVRGKSERRTNIVGGEALGEEPEYIIDISPCESPQPWMRFSGPGGVDWRRAWGFVR